MNRVYTDGSCKLAVGGWAWYNEDTDEFESGVEIPSTNQRMELYAALDALDHHMDYPELTIISDSAYLVNCMNDEWYVEWMERNWHSKQGELIANVDIWKPLIGLVQAHEHVSFEWVKGHAGDRGNEIVDALAREAMLTALGDS